MKKLILKKVLDGQGRRYKWLADELGVSYQAIWNWCNSDAKPTYDRIVRIAEILDVLPEDLYEEDQP